MKQGRIIRGYLGIQTGVTALRHGSDTEGVTVAEVIPGSPAAQAGVQPGDIIRKFDGRDVKNFSALRTLVAQAPLDKQVELEIIRDGKPLQVKTQIKEQPIDYRKFGVHVAETSRSHKPRGNLTIRKQPTVLWRQFTWTS